MPFQSEAQRRLMYAAAAGKDTKADISQAEAKRMVSHDEPGKLPEKVEKAGEGDGSDMAKQLLAQINEMSAKLNKLINSDEELEDWVDSKIVTAKEDLDDVTGYLSNNEDSSKKDILNKAKQCCEMLSKKKMKKSIHGSENTPNRVANTVDGIAKTGDEMGDYEKKAKGALDFRNQMKDFRRQHGSTIMDIAGGKKIPAERADAYHTARGQLVIGHGVGAQDIPPRIPGHLIDRPKPQAEEIKPLALPAAKSMEALTNPKSLLAKVEDCIKCMRKSSEDDLEKDLESALKLRARKRAHPNYIRDYQSVGKYTGPRNTYEGNRGRLSDYAGPGKDKRYFIVRNEEGKREVARPGTEKRRQDYIQRKQELSQMGNNISSNPEPIDYAERHKTQVKQQVKKLLQGVGQTPKNEIDKSEQELEKSSKKPFHGYNKKKHARSGGLNDSYRKKLNRETGSNLKRPVTKKNVKPGSKAGKRRKSFCARMSGVKGPTSKEGKLTPKGAALKRWRCSKSLNKSESVPLELRADRVLKSLSEIIKSNNVKPFGTSVYDETANLGRKMGRTGQVAEGSGPNTAIQQRGNILHGTMKDQTKLESKRLMQLNRKQPVNAVDLSKIPTDKRQEVLDAMLSGRSHPLLDQVARVVLTNTRGKKSTNKVGKSLSDLIKGDVIDFAGRKKQVSEPSNPASGKMSFTEIAQQNRANQQRMQQDRAARNEQTKRMYNIKPSTEALTSSPAEEKFYDAETGKERSLSEKPKRLGVDLFEGYPQSHIKNLINDYGVDGLGLTGAYEDAAMELHNENMEDQGLEYNEDTDEWLDSDGEVVDPDDHFPEEEEIMERMFDNHRHLMRDEEDPEEEKDTSKSFDKSNKIEGGKGDKSRKTDFPEKQIAEGLKVEREHTKDPKIAEEIALDHLTEDPRYYSKLKTSGLADELKKAKQAIEKLQKRCWEGYEPVPGKKPYSKGSCVKKAISAPAIEGGEYKGEKLDAHHHNRLGKEYREMARQAIAKGDKQTAAKHQAKSLFHFSRATEMGYEPPEE